MGMAYVDYDSYQTNGWTTTSTAPTGWRGGWQSDTWYVPIYQGSYTITNAFPVFTINERRRRVEAWRGVRRWKPKHTTRLAISVVHKICVAPSLAQRRQEKRRLELARM